MKEMLEALRDRRTLLVMILLPALVMPLATLGIPYLEQRQQRQLKTTIPTVAPSITLSVLLAALPRTHAIGNRLEVYCLNRSGPAPLLKRRGLTTRLRRVASADDSGLILAP
jgi:hypothetical protein